MLHYRVSGTSDGPCLLFLHGFLGDHHDWNGVIAALNSRARCIAADLPGHGLSTSIAPTDFDGAADAVVAVLDEAGFERCGIVGYSMGGRIGLHTVARHPERFTGLVLESASAGIAHDGERKTRYKRDLELADELEGQSLSEFLRWWYSQPMFASLSSRPDLLGTVLARRAQQKPEALAAALRVFSPGIQPPLWDRLKEIHIPVLVMAGELDAKYVLMAKSLYGRLLEHDREERTARPNASAAWGHRLRVIPECGHNIHLENPEIFVDAILNFSPVMAV